VTRGRELVCEVKPRVLTVRVATSIRSPRVPTR
jgi:hypothetical protein